MKMTMNALKSESLTTGNSQPYLDTEAVALAMASRRLSRCCLLIFSTNRCPSCSLRGGSGILNVGPGVDPGVASIRIGVPSISPHVIKGDASAPVAK